MISRLELFNKKSFQRLVLEKSVLHLKKSAHHPFSFACPKAVLYCKKRGFKGQVQKYPPFKLTNLPFILLALHALRPLNCEISKLRLLNVLIKRLTVRTKCWNIATSKCQDYFMLENHRKMLGTTFSKRFQTFGLISR